MRTKTCLMAVALVTALPASAQIMGGMPRNRTAMPSATWSPTPNVRDDISAGRESGQLSRRQAKALRREATGLDAIEARAPALSDAERAQFEAARQVMRERVTTERTTKK
ncbi:hypothetical protein HL653_15450 [Sphingomonas sp. AP4-R1]|uniref:hypothetical protein n=1 Tax=Sphingomonas sp. AP4-R1 TaxID=2735134 RepID=UPI001493AD54|nr:hypothetical protein [Sphingomonas sp. AP4-R1]QJU58976.1 hypothetical protein HL653_15450 [Sphingomonas sp. AP4-R1]